MVLAILANQQGILLQIKCKSVRRNGYMSIYAVYVNIWFQLFYKTLAAN